MTTKLTLSIERETIERAKMLSSKTGKSISKIVEEYLDSITAIAKNKRPAVEQLNGILKNRMPADMDWKNVKASHLKKKYGL